MSSRKINCVCAECGVGYRKRKDRVRSPDFCSQSCRSAATRRKRTVECPNCGALFVARSTQTEGGRAPYCSQSCASSHVPRTEKWNRNIANAQRGRRVLNGEDHPSYKGGLSRTSDGYIKISAGANAGRMQHTVLMEEKIGRRIKPNEVVHHRNHIKSDNRLENLQLMTRAEHLRHHRKYPSGPPQEASIAKGVL